MTNVTFSYSKALIFSDVLLLYAIGTIVSHMKTLLAMIFHFLYPPSLPQDTDKGVKLYWAKSKPPLADNCPFNLTFDN